MLSSLQALQTKLCTESLKEIATNITVSKIVFYPCANKKSKQWSSKQEDYDRFCLSGGWQWKVKDKSVHLLKNCAKTGPGYHRDEDPRALDLGEWWILRYDRSDPGARTVDTHFTGPRWMAHLQNPVLSTLLIDRVPFGTIFLSLYKKICQYTDNVTFVSEGNLHSNDWRVYDK